MKPSTCNRDLALGDQLISDRLKELGKKSSHMLTIEEQRKLKKDTEKDTSLLLPYTQVPDIQLPAQGPFILCICVLLASSAGLYPGYI